MIELTIEVSEEMMKSLELLRNTFITETGRDIEWSVMFANIFYEWVILKSTQSKQKEEN